MKIKIQPDILQFIKNHTLKNEGNEIYGWLLGYKEVIDNETIINIYAAYPAIDYASQNLIHAEPNPDEIASIQDYLPIGIINLGQYHSHPKNVFHSETDDRTLLQMAKMYPDVVSLVTNGDETRAYYVEDNEVHETQLIMETFSMDFKKISINVNIYHDFENRRKLASWVDNQLREISIDKKVTLKHGNKFKYKNKFKFYYVKKLINQPDVKPQLRNLLYEILSSDNIQYDLVHFQNLPLLITPNSFARKTALERSKLLSGKEMKQWQIIQN